MRQQMSIKRRKILKAYSLEESILEDFRKVDDDQQCTRIVGFSIGFDTYVQLYNVLVHTMCVQVHKIPDTHIWEMDQIV